jgi:transcriptional regulator with XRE-family HTH domain
MSSEVASVHLGRLKRRILELRVRSWSYRAIADEVNLSVNTVRRYYAESIAENIPDEDRKEALQLELAKLDESERRIIETIDLIRARAAAAHKEEETIRDGQGFKDPLGWAAPLLAKQEELLTNLRKRRAMLKGLDTPVVVQHNIKVRTEFDQEIEALVTELTGGGNVVTPPDMVIDIDVEG